METAGNRRPFLPGQPFVRGANLPWLDYGGDFGASAWRPQGGVSAWPGRADEALARLAGAGQAAVRWFLFGDGRAGLPAVGSGGPAVLDRHVVPDLEAALGLAERRGLSVLLVLSDFLWVRPARRVSGVQIGGRRRSLLDPAARERLLDGVFTPLFERFGTHPALAGWDAFNEPEWATLGFGGWPWRGAVRPGAMRSYLRDVAVRAREASPRPVTVGLASASGLPLVRGLGLDLYQVHWYDWLAWRHPLARPVTRLSLDAPVLLGEYPTRGSRHAPGQIPRLAREAGYRGALAWSLLARDRASDGAAIAAA